MVEEHRATNYFSLVNVSITDEDYQILPPGAQKLVRMYADGSRSSGGVWECSVPVYAVHEILSNQVGQK